MKHRTTAALPVLVLLALLAGAACAPAAAPPAAKPAPAASTSAPAPAGSAAPTTAAAAVAPTSQPVTASAPAPVKLRVATIRVTSDVGMYVAQDKGYYAEQGLDVEFVDFPNVVDIIPSLASGQIEVGLSAFAAGLYNALARGIDIRFVADKAATSPDPRNGFGSSLALAIPREYAESGRLRDYADLRGKTVASATKGSGGHILVDAAARKGGLTLADINHVELSFPDMNAALANKAVDATLQIDPLLTLGEAQGILVPWKRAAEIYPGQQVAAIIYGPRMAALGQDVGNRFMVAYVKGLRDYNDAFGPTRKNHDEVVSIIVNNTPVKDPALYEKMTWDYLNPDGYLNLDTLAQDLDWYVEHGYVTQKPDLTRAVDHSFADHAVRTLGPYRP